MKIENMTQSSVLFSFTSPAESQKTIQQVTTNHFFRVLSQILREKFFQRAKK